MITLQEVIFYLSLLILGYTYIGYPLIIYSLGRFFEKKPEQRDEYQPMVSVILAAQNEEKNISRKIENLQALDYPKEKLELIIVNNGSSDKTKQCVEAFPNVRLLELWPAQGKSAALNLGVSKAKGELLLFCDARQEISKDSVRHLVKSFADPKVGANSGELVLSGSKGPGIYWKYERIIRKAEGRFDSVVGATGALYMLRRELFQTIPPRCILDDVYTPMQIVLKGYRVLFEPQAKVFDQETELKHEFQRKARTLTGNFQLLEQLPLLHPLKNRLFIQFLSHKLFRLLCPYALLTLLTSNLLLTFRQIHPTWWFQFFMIGQIIFYGFALGHKLTSGKAGRLGRFAETFVTLNLAAVIAFKRYLRRDFTWTTAPKKSSKKT